MGEDFLACRTQIAQLLQEENQLMEIVKLIGSDVLPDDQKLVIETARVIRVGFLQQNAYHQDDTYVPLEKQLKMMRVILYLHQGGAGHRGGIGAPVADTRARLIRQGQPASNTTSPTTIWSCWTADIKEIDDTRPCAQTIGGGLTI